MQPRRSRLVHVKLLCTLHAVIGDAEYHRRARRTLRAPGKHLVSGTEYIVLDEPREMEALFMYLPDHH